MTPLQKARLIGVKALQSLGGVSLKLLPNGGTFTAQIQPVEVQAPEFQQSQVERDEAILTFVRADIGAVAVTVEDTFKDEAAGINYRVTKLYPRHHDILVKFHCTVWK